jgi:hypothetical protein
MAARGRRWQSGIAEAQRSDCVLAIVELDTVMVSVKRRPARRRLRRGACLPHGRGRVCMFVLVDDSGARMCHKAANLRHDRHGPIVPGGMMFGRALEFRFLRL